MDIKILYKWIKEYVDTDLTAQEFAKRMSLSGPSIEKWHFDSKLDDYVLDIEVTPNRVDMASVIGIAIESKAILKTQLKKDPYVFNLDLTKRANLDLQVAVNEPNLCNRYQAIVIKNVKIEPSPEWLKNRIESAGLNSINNLVDITNYVLLEYGQPTHVFDYNKIKGNKIIVRRANDGEEFVAIGGEKYLLSKENLVIADESSVVALAGVKGGEFSGVTEDTRDIIIESANFDAVSVRKTSRRNNLITDASLLFEKSLATANTEHALLRVAQLILEISGGEVASEIIDINNVKQTDHIIDFDVINVERILGVNIPTKDIVEILERLGFYVNTLNQNTLRVKVPFTRVNDVLEDYDLVEEIARIYGYQNIPSVLPTSDIPIVRPNQNLVWEQRVREILSGIGLTETYTYSLVSEKYLEEVSGSINSAIKIYNPLSTDFTHMRTDLVTSVLKIVEENEDLEEKLELFEISKAYIPIGQNFELPKEISKLCIVLTSNKIDDSYYKLQSYWVYLLEKLFIKESRIRYQGRSKLKAYSPNNSTEIFVDSQYLGDIGVINPEVKKSLKLKKEVSILEIDFDIFLKIILETNRSYNQIPKYPSVFRDFSFIFPKHTQWQDIKTKLIEVSGDFFVDARLFDLFKGKNIDPDKISISFTIEWNNPDSTLTDQEINEISEKIIKTLETELDGEIRK